MHELSDSPKRNESEVKQPEPNWLEANLLNPFVNAAVVTPGNAIANSVNFVACNDLVGKLHTRDVQPAALGTGEWFAQNVSGGLGAIIPYVIAGKVAGAGMRSLSGKLATESLTANFLKNEIAAQVIGASALDFARDTRPGETHLGNAAGGAAGFYIFSKGNAFAKTENFWQRHTARAGIGALGGVASLSTASLVSGEGLPGTRSLAEAAITGGTMNIVMPPLQKALTPSEIRSAYYNTKWKIGEGYTEARRLGYSALNALDLQHPVQRASNALYGIDDATLYNRAAAPLTADNNPIATFEREVPKYFRNISEREAALAAVEGPEALSPWGRHQALEPVRTEFGVKLLEMWHGTKDGPGIKHHTDVELATASGVPVERVAEIRKAVATPVSTHKIDENVSPLTVSLAKLANHDIEGVSIFNDPYVVDIINASRGKYFGYDPKELGNRMAMPSWHHYKDHGYGTPVEWSPFEPSPNLPSYFHGSMSPSLPSIARERSLFNSKEMRIRGIAQETGESANESSPRRAVSMTRDFDEAWAYHNHSPQSVAAFPLVYGISRDVAPRTWRAGSLEPGELLTNRLRFGDSIFGWRKSDISHIFAPDPEVAAIAQGLATRGVRGVRVVGFSEIPKPEWKPVTTDSNSGLD